MKDTLRILLVGIILATVVSGCGEKPVAEEEETLNRGLVGEVDTLDPHKNKNVQGHRVLIDLFEGLLRYSADGKLEGGVAKSWSVSEDGLEYVFELDESARWSNGEKLTANDFVFSFRRLVEPKTAAFYATFLNVIENAKEITKGDMPADTLGVVADGDYVLRIRLSKPTLYFPQLLTHPAASPLHQRSIEEHGVKFTRAENLVTNGAYVLHESGLNGVTRLKKNPFYRENGLVRIENVNYFIIVSDDSMYNQYRAGELHITGSIPSAYFKQIKEERGDELKIAPLLGVYYYGLNLKKEPFGPNKKLRKALSMAVDRETIVSAVLGRGELPAYSWVPPGIEGYTPPGFEYAKLSKEEREEEARRLYKEAGYSSENPAQFELRYNVGEGEQRVAVAIQSMWKTVLGAEAVLVNEEFKVLISNIQKMEITQAYRLSWVGDYFDPNTFLELMETNNAQNLTGYGNGEFDQLMAQASVEIDSTKRMSLLERAESIMLEDHPAIPIYYYVSKHLVKEEVKGWKQTTVDFHPSQYLWLEKKAE